MTAERSPRNLPADNDGAATPSVYRPAAPTPLDEMWIAAFTEHGGPTHRTEHATTGREPGRTKSPVARRTRVALLVGVSAAVLTVAVLVLGDDKHHTDAGLPANAAPSPVQLPITGADGGAGAGTATVSSHPTTEASPSASATKPTRTTARRSAAPDVSSSPVDVAYVGAASALCLDSSDSRLHLARCDGGSPQSFAQGSAHELRTANGLCAGAPGGDVRGTPVVAEECDGGKNQSWTVLADGSIRQGTLCLDAFNGGTAPGTPIQLWDCGGGGNQAWRASTAGH
ncbi:ricin-type beta-trefoil lectin domain protein [Streptomyces sp. NPDC086787]|uniref:ricin-type beta-trefoil lectin domain protein n=1 Tax=Streptomyces sp. NPDC086787 TaxID=3365759 RepID=UPI0037FC4219